MRARTVAALGTLILAAGAAAQTAPAPPRQDIPTDPRAIAEQQARFARWREALPPVAGPLAVVREVPASLPYHTVFRPRPRAGADAYPLVVFANGGCRSTPIEFTAFLAGIASHGYVVVAAGTDDVEFATTDFTGTARDGQPLQRVSRTVLTDATDWAVRENARAGSPYRHRIDVRRLAYMGQSCGGMQALSASRDPRTTTTVVLNSGRFRPDANAPANGRFPAAFAWSDLHAPVAFFAGGPTDVPAAHQSYAEIDRLPAFLADLPVGHTGAYPDPDPRWMRAVVGWLDWRLKRDGAAGRLFVGADCGLCRDPAWSVTGSKNLAPKRMTGLAREEGRGGTGTDGRRRDAERGR